MISNTYFLAATPVVLLLSLFISLCIKQKLLYKTCTATNVAQELTRLAPDRSDVLCASFYFAASAILARYWNAWSNESVAIGWYVTQMLLSLGYFAIALYGWFYKPPQGPAYKWHKKPIWQFKPSWQSGLIWLIGLLICIPLSIMMHWFYAYSVTYTFLLTVVHMGVLCLLLPVYLVVGWGGSLLCLAYPMYAKALPSILLDPSDGYTAAIGFLSFLTFPFFKKKQAAYQKKITQMEQREQARRKQHLQDILDMEFRLEQLYKLDQVRLAMTKDVLADLKIKWWKHKSGRFAFSAEAYHLIARQFRYLYNQSIENINEMTYDLSEVLEEEEEKAKETATRITHAD